MKIGIEVQRLFRKKRFGIESSSLELIKALREAEPGFEFVVFAKDDENRRLEPSENLRIRTLNGKLFVDFEQFFLPLAARKERIDLLHCTGNTTPYFCPVPIVQTLHDVIFMDTIPSDDSWYQRFGNLYRRKVVPLVSPRSKCVITVSEYEKQRILQRINIQPEKIHVVYNGINPKRFHAHHSLARQYEVRHKYGLPDDFILFLGNASSRKNPGRVLESYARYVAQAEKPLRMVTPGLSRHFIDEKLAVAKINLPSELFITPGYIDDEDLSVLYSLATMFLFPSLSEGFGMPIVEAMASGAPVITSAVSAMPEIAGDAALLVDPLDSQEMADAMLQLTRDASLRQQLRDAGFRNAARFSWQNAAAKVLNLYETVYAEAVAPRKEHSWFMRHWSHAFMLRPWK